MLSESTQGRLESFQSPLGGILEDPEPLGAVWEPSWEHLKGIIEILGCSMFSSILQSWLSEAS